MKGAPRHVRENSIHRKRGATSCFLAEQLGLITIIIVVAHKTGSQTFLLQMSADHQVFVSSSFVNNSWDIPYVWAVWVNILRWETSQRMCLLQYSQQMENKSLFFLYDISFWPY